MYAISFCRGYNLIQEAKTIYGPDIHDEILSIVPHVSCMSSLPSFRKLQLFSLAGANSANSEHTLCFYPREAFMKVARQFIDNAGKGKRSNEQFLIDQQSKKEGTADVCE